MTSSTSATPSSSQETHTISLFVRNQPGVLIRVALVFSRRGFNIDSLVVSPGAKDEFSRMTITCTGRGDSFEQISKQLTKLIDVVHAIDHTNESTIETESALVKIKAPLEQRTDILQIAEHYKAKVVDYSTDSLVLRLHGASEKLDYCLDVLEQYEIIELVRSGKIVMARNALKT